MEKTVNQKFNYTKWLPFDEIYTFDKSANIRSSKFIAKDDIVTVPAAGIYLIADSLVGPLDSPESVIYIGKTVGKNMWSSFHERLWKHCCKAIGECGGTYNSELQKDKNDSTEPKDTKKWSIYRRDKFKGFSTWYFSFYRLDESDFETAKDGIALMEDITMYAFSYYSNPKKALCNDKPPELTVKFPWMYK